MLEKVTSIEEFESKIPDINWDTITNKELNEVPTIELGRIKNVLDMSRNFWSFGKKSLQLNSHLLKN
jgi:hypothetical protein